MILEIPDHWDGGQILDFIFDFVIRRGMKLHNNKKCYAGKWMGVCVRTFRNYMKKYPEFDDKRLRILLTEERRRALPKTLKECEGRTFWMFGGEKLKQEIRDYYEKI